MSLHDLDDFKLETTFKNDPACVLHTSCQADRARGIRKAEVVEEWVPQKPDLGVGTFGTVRLEKKWNQHGGTISTHHAVKLCHKAQMARLNVDYKKELIALTKFSRDKVCCHIGSMKMLEYS
jgi:hypothetical protein